MVLISSLSAVMIATPFPCQCASYYLYGGGGDGHLRFSH